MSQFRLSAGHFSNGEPDSSSGKSRERSAKWRLQRIASQRWRLKLAAMVALYASESVSQYSRKAEQRQRSMILAHAYHAMSSGSPGADWPDRLTQS